MKYKTLLLNAHNPEDMATAAQLLKDGQLVAVPTETVYGLAADARNPHAVAQIFVAKNRPADHPLIVHIAGADQMQEWAQDIPDVAYTLADAFWPGPLTLLLNKLDTVSDVVTGGLSTVALRVPSHPVMRELLTLIHTGLAAPSANPHKRISPTTAQHVLAGLSGNIAAVLDGGQCEIGLESTIVDVTSYQPRILRPGPITQKMLEDVLGIPVAAPQMHDQKVAGNMAVHYQPHTRTLMMNIDEITAYLQQQESSAHHYAIMHHSLMDVAEQHVDCPMPVDKIEYARLMYIALHDLDGMHVDTIIIETPPADDEWSDIRDRLEKAAAKI